MYKLLVLAAFVFVGAVLVLSEDCDHYSDCGNTQCLNTTSSHVVCKHDLCTCVNHLPCNTVSDCTAAGSCSDHHKHQHCLDGMCLCLKDDVIDD